MESNFYYSPFEFFKEVFYQFKCKSLKTKIIMRKILTPEEKHLKNMDKFRPIYEKVKSELNLEGSEIEQIHQLVDEGNTLQGMICCEADKIKINGFELAKNLIKIDKGTWMEFVSIVAKKLYGNLSEKALDKLNESIELKQYLSGLRQSFFDSYLSDESLKIADEDGKINLDFDTIENSEFNKLMEDCAKIRDHINNVLYKRYTELKKAAYFITNGKLSFGDFKDMVDWEHYKDSDDPKYPSRSWKIYKKFAKMARLMRNYEFNQIDDLNYEFGINFELTTPHEITHPWQIDEDFED